MAKGDPRPQDIGKSGHSEGRDDKPETGARHGAAERLLEALVEERKGTENTEGVIRP